MIRRITTFHKILFILFIITLILIFIPKENHTTLLSIEQEYETVIGDNNKIRKMTLTSCNSFGWRTTDNIFIIVDKNNQIVSKVTGNLAVVKPEPNPWIDSVRIYKGLYQDATEKLSKIREVTF